MNATHPHVRICRQSGSHRTPELVAEPSKGPGTQMSAGLWSVARLAGGVAILAVLVWRLGTGPFLEGIDRIDGSALASAAAVTLVTTVAAAYRWRVVSRGLGVGVSLTAATASYYRSQFLNTALPGGVLGDVHRGVRHGQDAGDVSRGLRAVAWERIAGQVVQITLALVVLLALASPVHSSMPVVAAAVAAAVLAAVALARALRRSPCRWSQTVRADVRDGLLARHAWPGVAVASIVVVTGHTATFLIAARTAGTTASPLRMLPIAMLVLLAMAVPTNIGGWGPREGVAAWLFGAAGFGADRGVAAATVYGVLVLVACLPGALVLVADWLRRRASTPLVSAIPVLENGHTSGEEVPRVRFAGADHRALASVGARSEGAGHG